YFTFQWSFLSVGQDERTDPYRSVLWKEAYGNVLELGPGFSSSLKHLHHKTTNDSSYNVDPAVIHSYTALEPNPFMYNGLQENAEKNGFRVKYDHENDPNNIPQAVLDGAPYDTILTSFALCTAAKPEESIKNIIKLLKPGGSYIFVEHVRHPTPGDPLVVEDNGVNGWFWGKMQDWVNPIWNILGHGCHITRKTGEVIASMDGWESVDYKMVRVNDILIAYFLPMAFGTAIKAK
ncbi:hypothetical protein COEREDRAFT_36998, partial [Coemansia reversa NRRL 1564]